MKYLIRNKKQKVKAHYWTGLDTYCRLWSTGGMNQDLDYIVSDNPEGKPICTMCDNVEKAYAFNS